MLAQYQSFKLELLVKNPSFRYPTEESNKIKDHFKINVNYIIEGDGALVNEAGEETPLKAGDFAHVNPEGLTQENRARWASSWAQRIIQMKKTVPEQGRHTVQDDLRRP